MSETFLSYEAYLSGMYGAKYVWIAPFWTTDVWWVDVPPSEFQPCTEKQIISAVNSTIHLITTQREEGLPDLDYKGVVRTWHHLQVGQHFK